jgi:Thioesterase-like superfamily
MRRLLPSTRVIREGKRLQLLEIELASEGRPCLRASALRMRTAISPEQALPPSHPFPGSSVDEVTQRHSKWVETIRIEGDYDLPGPGARWVRFLTTVVAGEALLPLESAAMLADFGSVIGPLVSPREWPFANVDISIHLTRLPRENWLLTDAISESTGNGIGITNTRDGRVAKPKSLYCPAFLAPRPEAHPQIPPSLTLEPRPCALARTR